MNKRAKRMTFWVTCVVDKIVVTHFMKPVDGSASAMNWVMTCDEDSTFSMLVTTADDSNQKRHVS